MKKLFISQPMKGKTDEEILREREQAVREAEKYLKENGMQEEVQVIDSFFQSAPVGARPLWFWVKVWNCFRQLTLYILQRTGRKPEDAGLNTCVQYSTNCRLSDKKLSENGDL